MLRFIYDDRRRLTGEQWGHMSGGSFTEDHKHTWDYDWVGSRRQRHGGQLRQVDALDLRLYLAIRGTAGP